MKRILSLALSLVLVLIAMPLCVGCGGGYKKVQSVRYTRGGESSATVESCYYFKTTQKSVSINEYEEAANKHDYVFSTGKISGDGTISVKDSYSYSYSETKLTVKDLKAMKGKTYYVKSSSLSSSSSSYYKVSYEELIISYVEVKFLDDGTLNIRYYDSKNNLVTNRIKAENYVVNYFYD